ncbi:hypothetical protein CBL_10084 [Carabus blaptoides fortunei]
MDEMFPKKIPSDLHGCEIKVVANIVDPYVMDANLTTEDARKIGIEAAFLRHILIKMNLTLNLITTTYLELSFMFPNGTVIGTHEYLLKGECDLVYDGNPKIYMFKQAFATVMLTMHTSKGFPLLDRMNDIILQSMAAGFHVKWMHDIEVLKSSKESELRPLRTDDFRGAFIILALGYLTAILSFVVELKKYVSNN